MKNDNRPRNYRPDTLLTHESLIQPSYPERGRTAIKWDAEGPLVRIHIGLEDPQDLIADLAQGLDKLQAVAAA